MNKIEIKQKTGRSDNVTGGEIFINSAGIYMVVRTHNTADIPYALMSLETGNLWSTSSLFGDTPEEFERFYGTLTITTE